MEKILYLIASPRGRESYSFQLGQAIVGKLQQSYPNATIDEWNLNEDKINHVGLSHIQSFFTPPEHLTEEDKKTLQYSDEAIRRVNEADFIVIGTPVYNF